MRCVWGILVALAGIWAGGAMAGVTDIPLTYSYAESREPLTTEKVWEIESQALNPHRLRWVLERLVTPRGLKPIARPGGGYGVEMEALEAVSRSLFRAGQDWYAGLKEFPCVTDPLDGFATERGVRLTAESASERWKNELSEARLSLVVRLKNASSQSEASVMKLGQEIFAEWLKDLLARNFEKFRESARKVEWEYYTRETKKICRDNQAKRKTWIEWEKLSDSTSAPDVQVLAARAPAKRWKGVFSVRVTLDVAQKRLNGEFAVDPTSDVSLVSPQLLASQGVVAALAVLPEAPLRRVQWRGRSQRAILAAFDRLEIGKISIEGARLWLTNTDLDPPSDVASTCCDGVLGRDFLGRYAVEFNSLDPTNVTFWERRGFSKLLTHDWAEVSTGIDGKLLSHCYLSSGKGAKKILGVEWMPSSDFGLKLRGREGLSLKYKLVCGDTVLGRDLVPESIAGSGRSGAELGLGFLASPSFVLDLSHGRLWFPRR